MNPRPGPRAGSARPGRRAEQGGRARGAPARAHAARRRGGPRHLRGHDVAPVRRQVPACRPTRAKEWELAPPAGAPVPLARRALGTRGDGAHAGSRAPISRLARAPQSISLRRVEGLVRVVDVPGRRAQSRLARNAARFALWRAVEAQHVVSTMALVDTLDEQHVLERLLEASKPPVPAARRRLHYLLVHAVPLSRRRPAARAFAGRTTRACSTAPTKCAPRARSSAIGAGVISSTRPRCRRCRSRPQTVFRAQHRRALRSTCARRRSCAIAPRWTAPVDYARLPALRASPRARRDVGAIRYESVRDPQHGGCCAVLTLARVREARPGRAADVDAVGDARARHLAAHRHRARRRVRVAHSPMADGTRTRSPVTIRALGRTEYEPTWRAMQAFTAARDARHARRDLADRASAGLHARPRRPARAPAARQRHPGAQGRSRRPGHVSRPGPARRVHAVRPAARAAWHPRDGPAPRGGGDRMARTRRRLPRTASRRRPASTSRAPEREAKIAALGLKVRNQAAPITDSRSTSRWISRPSPTSTRAATRASR